jgi:hypothetical protein
MIFKRWFKPKWQHENAAIRQLAIADLDHQTPQQKEILHELAFNDGAEAVRRAALERLNEFSLWWQASKHESAERLKQFAEQQLISMLLENRVSAHLKLQFIAECNRTSVLEKLATAESDPQVKFDLLQRLARQDLILQALHEPILLINQKQQLLSAIQDEKVLEKLSKSLDPVLLTQVETQLAEIREARLKPERVRKQVVLFLAKFNTIREKSDVLDALQTFEQAKQHWSELLVELPCLVDSEEFIAKYNKIALLTESSLAPKLAQAQAEREKALFVERTHRNSQQFATQLNLLNQQIGSALSAGELETAASQQTALDALLGQIASAELTLEQRKHLQQQAQQIQQKLDKLPELAEGLAQTARLIFELSAQALPTASEVNVAYQGFTNWQKTFKQQMKTIGQLMPEQFIESYEALVMQWKQHCEPLLAEQQKSLRQLKSKLAEFKRLYDAGKYNVLFGLYKGIEQQYAQLSSDLQMQLQSDKTAAEELINKLAGLQAYIATPRKQQMLEEIQSLIVDDSYAMPERAAQIKQLRNNWNSLGKADAELDESLNQQFNLACEQAFAPCREYFAKQDAERALAANKKAEVIAQLTANLAANLQGKQLEQVIQQTQKDWEQSGNAEKSVYAQLQPQYHALFNQLKQQQVSEFKSNSQAKQLLVEKAAALVAHPEIDNLVAAVKDLQAQWTAIGFAGRKLDQQLWSNFREHCDAIFAKRSETRQLQLQQIQQRKQELESQFQQLSEVAANSATLSAIEQSTADLAAFSALEDVRSDRQLTQKSRELKAKLAEKANVLQVEHEKSAFDQLFSALAEPNVNASALPAVYRLVFNQQQERQLSRADLTLALEWIAGVASPESEQARRQQVQMQLLTDKHNSGGSSSQNELLGRWLQYGPLSSDELPLLARVRSLYLPD